ncbi:hypothetical protein TREMEDRAFT_73470, partial [Tremella mesenterica DSM 1558]|uniref:uncharacterized protein n=1 Tax=Tremella mesenterica (strain ATCC 24925 / CBS 8224 / DSM 1558 / NBRC 9311 / NRRL Y-6157 / RJB 2259-6 / UBC 559-6) TaxID=578456 RepID=UPI0003F49DD1
MQMIVYGFPSKLTALQFEWAWQKPELSRHLRAHDAVTDADLGPLFKKDGKRNHPTQKILVAHSLLNASPFCRLPLHIRFFNKDSLVTYLALRSAEPSSSASDVSVILDLGGVSGSTNKRHHDTPGVTSLGGPIDVTDDHFRLGSRVWQKWQKIGIGISSGWSCGLCGILLQSTSHLAFALCSASGDDSCTFVSHLHCLASHFLEKSSEPRDLGFLLPVKGRCPKCSADTDWGEVIRSCFARQEGQWRERKIKYNTNAALDSAPGKKRDRK